MFIISNSILLKETDKLATHFKKWEKLVAALNT